VVVTLLGTTAYFGVGYYVYNLISTVRANCLEQDRDNTPANITWNRPNSPLNPDDFELSAPYETVSFPSRDSEMDVTISAWWMRAPQDPDQQPTVILVHGLGSCKGSEHILMINAMLHRANYNTLMIDLRNMGSSTITNGRNSAGIHESRDVLGAWDWLVNEQGVAPERIGVMSHSLGAASTMIAMGQEPRMRAVFEDSGFADLREVVVAELGRYNVPTFFFEGSRLMGLWVGNVDLISLSPLDAMSRLDGRWLFITHGDQDKRLSVDYAYALAEVAEQHSPNVELWIAEGSDHVEAVFNENAEYERRVVDFFNRALRGA
jgi:uncharacterized protein